MTCKPLLNQDGRFRLVFACALLLGSPAFGQEGTGTGTNPGDARPKTGRMKLSESRADEKALPAEEASKPAPKKDSESEPAPIGFFGDTKKFTRFGGWGSFGNAMGQYGFARATLIGMPPVQEELKLTDEQKKKLKDWQEGMRKKGEEMGRSMREKNGGDPMKAGENQPISTRIVQFTSMMNQVSSFVKENEAGLAKILTAPQRKRLNQIALQMEGISALLKPEIIEELALLDDDVEQIQQILNQSRAQQMTTWIGSMMTMRQPPRPANDSKAKDTTKADPTATDTVKADPTAKPASGPDAPTDAKTRATREKAMRKGFETMRDRTDQIHSKAVKDITNVLSRSQRARFEILLGPPFDPSKVNDLGRPPRREAAPPASDSKPGADTKL